MKKWLPADVVLSHKLQPALEKPCVLVETHIGGFQDWGWGHFPFCHVGQDISSRFPGYF